MISTVCIHQKLLYDSDTAVRLLLIILGSLSAVVNAGVLFFRFKNFKQSQSYACLLAVNGFLGLLVIVEGLTYNVCTSHTVCFVKACLLQYFGFQCNYLS